MTVKKTTGKQKGKATRKKAPRPATLAITGVNGFLGSTLLHALELSRDYPRIIALDKRKPPFPLKKTRFYRVDLTETLADSKIAEIFKKENVQTVIHTAFLSSPIHNSEHAHELQSVGTMYLLNASRAQGIHKFVLASTTDVYGAYPTNPNYLSENYTVRGWHKSRFIRDKIDAERQVQTFAKRNPKTAVTILRPCTTLGPRVRNFKTTFLQRPAVFTVMGYDPLMQFVHEEDVVRAFLKVLAADYPGIYNIVGKGVLPLSRVLHLTGVVGVPVPAALLYPMAQLMWYTDLFPAPPNHLDFLKYLCVADGTKAEQKLSFAPHYSTKETLQAFVGAERLRKVRLLEESMQEPA